VKEGDEVGRRSGERLRGGVEEGGGGWEGMGRRRG